MLNQESNTLPEGVIDEMLLLLYNIDLKLNELFTCSSASFKKSSYFFKASVKPLQVHRANVTKLMHLPGLSRINGDHVKDSITLMTAKLQFHDVIEQRLKHIRQIHTELIQEIIAQKKSTDKKKIAEIYIHLIAKINIAQVDNINSEYTTYCKKLDESLQLIKIYFSEWLKIAPTLSASESNDDILFIIQQNSEFTHRIIGSIKGFEEDVSYRQMFSKTSAEIIKSLSTLSSLITTPYKALPDHNMFKRLEGMYTTQGEREVFNKIIHAGEMIRKQNLISQPDSGVDFF